MWSHRRNCVFIEKPIAYVCCKLDNQKCECILYQYFKERIAFVEKGKLIHLPN